MSLWRRPERDGHRIGAFPCRKLSSSAPFVPLSVAPTRACCARCAPTTWALSPCAAPSRVFPTSIPLLEDAIVGCSFPEGEQGMNMARIARALAGLPHRSAASPSTASAPRACRRADGGRPHPRRRGRRDDRRRRRVDEPRADGRQQAAFNPSCSTSDENVGIAYGMGLTAEKVAAQMEGRARRRRTSSRAGTAPARCEGQQRGEFADEITPVERRDRFPISLPASRHR